MIAAAPYLVTILILLLTLIPAALSSAATSSVGNNNTGAVTQSAADVTSTNTNTATTGASTSSATSSPTATTGASTSGANNSIKVERGAAYAAPSLGKAEVGTEVTQLHSFLGGATLSNTELDTRVKMKIEIIIDAYDAGLITENAAKARIYLALEDMDTIQKQRRVPVLGLFGLSCRQRSLFNGMGLLCN